MKLKDVTHLVEFGDPDGENVPLIRCICGASWHSWEGPILHPDEGDPAECESCGRRFVIRLRTDVYEVS